MDSRWCCVRHSSRYRLQQLERTQQQRLLAHEFPFSPTGGVLSGCPAYGESYSPSHQSAALATHGAEQEQGREHSASIAHDFGSWVKGNTSASAARGARTAIEADRGLPGAVSAALDDV